MKITTSTIFSIIFAVVTSVAYVLFFNNYINDLFPIKKINAEFILYTFALGVMAPLILVSYYTSYCLIKLDMIIAKIK